MLSNTDVKLAGKEVDTLVGIISYLLSVICKNDVYRATNDAVAKKMVEAFREVGMWVEEVAKAVKGEYLVYASLLWENGD